MDLKKENYTYKGIVCLVLYLCLPVHSLLSQSNCFVRVADEPTVQYMSRSVSSVHQIINNGNKVWTDISFGSEEDNQHTKVQFSGQQCLSGTLKFSDFRFNIPQGSRIDGIIVTIKGRRSGAGFIKDNKVRLTVNNEYSINAAGKGYNIANVFAKSVEDKKWKYGYQEKKWGRIWTASQINDASFGLELEVINITTKDVEGFIDNVNIEVEYTPLPTYCLTDCFPIYIDPVPGASTYFWHIPSGFEMISRSEKNNIIDFKVNNAQSKIYNVCVDVLDQYGQVMDQCCRDLRIRSCVPAKVGDFVWNDANYNGLQDIGEPGLSAIKIDLYKSNGSLVSSTLSSANGQYTFVGLEEDNYYIKINLPQNFTYTKNVVTDDEINSKLNNGTSTRIFNLQFGDDIKNIDLGLIKLVNIGDFVWEDLNYNGIQESGESGLKDIKVVAFDESNSRIDSTVSDDSGKYLFNQLIASKYRLQFYTPTSYIVTKPTVGNSDMDSDINSSLSTSLIDFQNTTSNLTIDAGFARYGSIGDLVWNDIDQNGIQDANELGEANIVVYLVNEAGIFIDTTYTDAVGQYGFSKLLPGKYSIYVDLPPFTSPTLFSTAANGSDLKLINGLFGTEPFELLSGVDLSDIDLGYAFMNSNICGKAWKDIDGDGQLGIDEKGCENVTVTLIDQLGVSVAVTWTDAQGQYCFDSLVGGSYRIAFAIEDSMQFTDPNVGNDVSDSDVLDRIEEGYTDQIILMPGDTITNVDAGIVLRRSIGDFIWNDVNYDGIQDSGELGINRVHVILYDNTGQQVADTYSNADGFYIFNHIYKGKYSIEIDTLDAYLPSKHNQTTDAFDNNVLPDYSIPAFEVSLTEDRLDIDAGFVKKLFIGDYVWEDMNGNGLQDVDEQGLDSVNISVYDDSAMLIGTTISDSLGYYNIGPLPANQYEIKFGIADVYNSTLYQAGDITLDNDVLIDKSTSIIDFSNQQENLNIDAGFVRYGTVGDFVWQDVNQNGTQDIDETGLSNWSLHLKNESGDIIASTVTDTLGYYKFDGVWPGKYFIELESPVISIPTINTIDPLGSDLITDGQKLFTEIFTIKSGSVIDDLDLGVIIKDSRICGQIWNDQDGNGQYTLDEELVSGLSINLLDEAGLIIDNVVTDTSGQYCFDSLLSTTYYISVEILDDLQFTDSNIGADVSDSDIVDRIDIGNTEPLVLGLSEHRVNIDAGILKRSVIGDYVWYDHNYNGIQDSDESGLDSIIVTLLDDSGNTLASELTDENGGYFFQNIVKGKYQILMNVPEGYLVTLANQGNDYDDNDLSMNGESSLFDVRLAEDRIDIDGGLIRRVSIGDFVWEDTNGNGLQDSNEKGLDEVIVHLLNSAGFEVAATLTDSMGQYSFSNIPALSYSIAITPDLGYLATKYQQGDIQLDSDCQDDFSTPLIDFSLATADLSIDFGLVKTACIGDQIWLDENEDGILDATEKGLKDVLIELSDNNNEVINIFVTDSSGKYQFCNLLPGQYNLTFKTTKSYLPTIFGIDSDIETINGIYTVATFNLMSGEKRNDIDGGFIYKPVSRICGLTWEDSNGNGSYESDEPVHSNVPMVLLDGSGNKMAKLKSDAQGQFCIEQLPPGSYFLRYYIGDNYQFTFSNIGDDDKDSDAIGFIDSATTDALIVIDNIDLLYVYAGITKRSAIGDYVWFDENNNGIQDLLEIGIPGIQVNLLNEQMVALDNTTTDATGKYRFDKLVRGNYFIQFPINPSFNFALKNATADLGSDANENGVTDQILIEQNIDNYSIDAGYALKGALIAGETWQDVNKDTIRGSGDVLLKNIIVYLYDESGQLILQTVSDQNGAYSFFPVTEGKYYLQFDSTVYTSFSYAKSNDPYNDVNHKYGRGTTEVIDVLPGSINASIDAGYVSILSSISGLAWLDDNGNGILEQGETPPSPLKVFLYKNNALVDSTTTNVLDGKYTFDSLFAASYIVKFDTINERYAFTQKIQYNDTIITSSVDIMGLSDTMIIENCQKITGINAGYSGFGMLHGEAFLDLNENGLRDDLTLGINNVAVSLIDFNGVSIFTDTTDLINLVAGQFSFLKIPAGEYRLKVKRPLFYIFSEADVNSNGNDDIDSDVVWNGTFDAISAPFTVKSNSTITDLDFGLIFRVPMNSSIAGVVWDESIVDGIRSNDEILKQGQVIILYKNDGSEVKRDTTDTSGRYAFQSLTEGFYYVKADLIASKTTTFLDRGNDEMSDNDFSDGNVQDATHIFYLGIAQDTSHIDLGIADEVNIGNFVWNDEDFDGIQDISELGLPNVGIRLKDASDLVIKSTKTDANGNYTFVNIPVSNYILEYDSVATYSASLKTVADPALDNDMNDNYKTDLQFFDAGIHNDVDAGFVKNGFVGDRIWVDFDANGMQNAGEPGKDSIEIQLCNSNGSYVAVDYTSTDMFSGQPGLYGFDNIKPGNYFIKVIIPSKFKATQQGNINTDLNSDINALGISEIFTLLPNEVKKDIDAGIFLPGCIGNRVWLDENKNGIQDVNEQGVADIEVKLFKSNGQMVGSGRTDNEGLYILENLPQGLYYAEFKVDPQYKFTLLDEGDETTDNDANQNGVTPLISLAHGAKYYDLDAGIYLATVPPTGNALAETEDQEIHMPLVTPNPALNQILINLPFEDGIITLYDGMGKKMLSFDQTSKAAYYNISNLQPGVYNLVASHLDQSVTTKFIKVD